MRRTALMAIGLILVIAGFFGQGCKKKDTSSVDRPFQHTPEHTHGKIQALRLQLTEAMEKKNLKYVHDSMFYFKDLLEALSAGLEGEKKQRVDEILKELTIISEEIDNSAGRGNQAATEANLQKLIDRLKTLEMEFKGGKK